MYWALYKTYSQSRWLVYDGNKQNLKFCIDPKYAEAWYEDNKNSLTTIEWKRPIWILNISVPISDELKEADREFPQLINKKWLPIVTQQIWNQFLDKYQFNTDGTFALRTQIKTYATWTLIAKRNFIEWLLRVKPIMVETWIDKNTNLPTYMWWPIHQNFWVKWNVDIEEAKQWIHVKEWIDWNSVMWVYAPQLLAAMLPKAPFDWNRLQAFQRDILLRRWQETVILACRWSWKSMLAAYIAMTFLFKQDTSYDDELRWVNIHYFGISEPQLDQVAIYVVNMVKTLIKNKKAIKYNKTDMEVILKDGDVEKKLKLMSSESLAKGRWERPTLVIIDEAWYINEEVYKVAIGTSWVPIMMITTVNPWTKKNWAYDKYLEWLERQRDYEPIDDVINSIWKRVSDVSHPDMVNQLIKDDVFKQMKQELYAKRPLVSLKYTIDDVEYLTEDEKKQLIERAARKWEKFLAAEYYSELVDDVQLLNYEWLSWAIEYERWDNIVMWYDVAKDFDNPALSIVWLKWWMAYVLDSIILPKDPALRITELKKHIALYKIKWNVTFAVDATKDENILEYLWDRWINVDYPIKFTPWHWVNYKWRFHLCWKSYLVNLMKDEFIAKANIKFNSMLHKELWLFEEMDNFKMKENWAYAWTNWYKDDQIAALLMALYVSYHYFLKDEFAVTENRNEVKDEDYWTYEKDLEREQQEYELQDEEISQLINYSWL